MGQTSRKEQQEIGRKQTDYLGPHSKVLRTKLKQNLTENQSSSEQKMSGVT